MKQKIFKEEEIPNMENEVFIDETDTVLDNTDNNCKDNKNFNSKFLKFSEHFDNSRLFWADKISQHSENFKHIERITELQAELFSDRQIILEQKHSLYELISKMNNQINKKKKRKFIEYSTNYDLKLNGREKETFIDADLSNEIQLSDIVDNHIIFLEQTIKTIDSIIFGVKYRVSLHEITEK